MGIIVFESLLPVFLVIAVGLALRKFDIVPESDWRGVELLGYWLLFPVLVLESLINMDLSSIDLGAITLGYMSAVLIQLILVWSLRGLLRQKMNVNDRSFSSIFQTSTRWNAFIALAIASKLVGAQGLAIVALIMAFTIPFLNIVNIVVLTICTSDTRPTLKTTLLNTLKVPLIWGALGGLFINIAGIPVYEPLLVSMDVVGRAGLGIGLLTVGAGIRISAMQTARANVIISIFAKLVLFPALVYFGCVMFGVTGMPLQIAVLCASVSTAMNGYVLARQMGGDVELYAASASLQVVVSMFTIPLILMLIAGSV